MGLLAAGDGIGFVIGSLLIGLMGNRIKISGKIFLGGCLGVAIFLLAFALSPWFLLSLFILIVLGICQSGFSTMQAGILLASSPTSFHSRVFGAQGMAVSSGQMGNVEMGALAALFGISASVAINAGVGLVLLILVAIFMPALRRPIVRQDEPPDEPQQPQAPPSKASGVFHKPRSGLGRWPWRRGPTPEQRRSTLRQKLKDLRKNRPKRRNP